MSRKAQNWTLHINGSSLTSDPHHPRWKGDTRMARLFGADRGSEPTLTPGTRVKRWLGRLLDPFGPGVAPRVMLVPVRSQPPTYAPVSKRSSTVRQWGGSY